MNNSEHLKAVFGLIGIWTSWLIGHMAEIQTWVSILASCAAFVASIVYITYLIIKIRREK